MATSDLNYRKRGMISNFIIFFMATIAIVLILTVYIIGGGMISKFDKSSADVAIPDEDDVGVVNVLDYSKQYVLLNEAKFLVAKGTSVDGAIAEVGYG